jgi:hypothetical protein
VRPYERWRHALDTGEAFRGECRIKTSEGMYRWFSASAIPYREDGKAILRWYGVLMDIHEAHALSVEHEITLELQRALLPGLLPVLPGATLSAGTVVFSGLVIVVILLGFRLLRWWREDRRLFAKMKYHIFHMPHEHLDVDEIKRLFAEQHPTLVAWL